MDGKLRDNDISHVVEADRAHVWHHLIQHAPWTGADPKADPRIIVEGRGMRVWDQKGREHIDGRLGRGLDGQCRLRARAHRQRGPRPAHSTALFRGLCRLDPRRAFLRETDLEDAGDEPGLLHQLRLRGE